MEKKAIRLKVWGCRGSHPTPGLKYVKYGGNTACVEVLTNPGEEKIIFDGGTGLGFLGIKMKRERNIVANIIESHIHQDHKFSIPHFFPLYVKGNEIKIWVTQADTESFEKAKKRKLDLEIITDFYNYPYHHSEFQSVPELKIMHDPSMHIGDYKVDTIRLEHFEGSNAYKVSRNGKSFIYAPDVSDISTNDEKTVEFCKGVDLIIWDSLYTAKEIAKALKFNVRSDKKHSSIESVIKLAHRAGIPRVIHFHHSPLRSDKRLTKLEKMAKRTAHELTGGKVKNKFARDGMIIEI
jgi:phosphoribosyl 1,2-cyclic phosphodiesterase